MATIPKAELFRQLGYGGDPDEAEALLEQHGLSNPKKQNISAAKLDGIRRLFAAEFMLVCQRGDCQAAARRRGDPRRTALAASRADCEICGGSVNNRAVDEMVDACKAAGWSRICVVGGSPNARSELETLVAGRLELRLIDGTQARTGKRAQGDVDWADKVAIWGSTQLAHKVSNLYSGPKVIAVARRSLKELAFELVASARGTA